MKLPSLLSFLKETYLFLDQILKIEHGIFCYSMFASGVLLYLYRLLRKFDICSDKMG